MFLLVHFVFAMTGMGVSGSCWFIIPEHSQEALLIY